MTNIDRAADIIYGTLSGKYGDFSHHREVAQALADAGLLTPATQIIRTVEELEALDPNTMVWARHYGPYTVGALTPDPFAPERTSPLPAVIICEAADVRAARKALKEA